MPELPRHRNFRASCSTTTSSQPLLTCGQTFTLVSSNTAACRKSSICFIVHCMFIASNVLVIVSSLCGRPIGRITRLARPSVPYGLVNRKQKKCKKSYYKGFPGTSKCSANFRLKRSNIRVTDGQKPQEIATYLAYVYLWVASQAPAAQAPTAN